MKKMSPGQDPATVNIAELAPERPLPEWIGRYQKAKNKTAAASRKTASSSSAGPSTAVDSKNMRKSWKTEAQKSAEELAAERVKRNRRPQAMRQYPGDIRQSSVPADSSVAMFLSTQKDFCPRKDFASASGKLDYDPDAPFFAEDKNYKAAEDLPPPPVRGASGRRQVPQARREQAAPGSV
jgi:hypothetical protein